jgi:hypothetical protein
MTVDLYYSGGVTNNNRLIIYRYYNKIDFCDFEPLSLSNQK